MSRANEPAFPVPGLMGVNGELIYPTFGMTLREYYAGLAMAGLLANLAALHREGFMDHEIEEFAVMRADALIAALEEK